MSDKNTNYSFAILVPTLNAGDSWDTFLMAVNAQSVKAHKKFIVDSGSSDNTVNAALASGFKVISISKNDFNHGAVRQQLAELAGDVDVCVFLTQDALLASDKSIENLISPFATDSQIGLAYGRQLPHKAAKTLETHARLFNYPAVSGIRSLSDKDRLGFKTIFCSNSFAAYRKEAIIAVGGFPADTIMGEDTIVAAKMLNAGYKIAYTADATVYHSHSYTLIEEFKRYFDTGVFHSQHRQLKEQFGKADGEGVKFVKSEIGYVMKNNISLLPYLSISVLSKWLGYKLGSRHKLLHTAVVKSLSMHKSYWDKYH
jgi:rhamnosyltransferase